MASNGGTDVAATSRDIATVNHRPIPEGPVLTVPTTGSRPGVETDPSRRPRLSRHLSLPRLSLTEESASIFGSTNPSPTSQVAQTQIEASLSRHVEPAATFLFRSTPTTQRLAKQDGRGDAVRSIAVRRQLPKVEKEVDDPTTPPPTRTNKRRQRQAVVTSLSRLFAAQALVSPEASRQSSYGTSVGRPSQSSRGEQFTETASLPDHVYTRGLIEGRHSDITIHAFGHSYKLHRLILDQAPFFRTALSEPWIEASVSETTLHPEDMDPAISQNSFELALRRLYGCSSTVEEEQHAVGLFATGSWLEMPDLVDSAVDNLLRTMSLSNLSFLIRLVTNNYYGAAGDKVMVAAKSMLCRDGWRMPLKYWEDIPGDTVREIVGGDGFFVDGEWERWVFARTLLDRRLKQCAGDLGLMDDSGLIVAINTADRAALRKSRFDSAYRLSNSDGDGLMRTDPPTYESPYSQPDIEPLLCLLDHDIYYVHLDFEQLQVIRGAKDVLDVPVVSEKVVADALWQQMELRQRVVNICEGDEELGISMAFSPDEDLCNSSTIIDSSVFPTSAIPDIGQRRAGSSTATQATSHEMASNDRDRPRKFWIPSSDRNMVIGVSDDQVTATFSATVHQGVAREPIYAAMPQDVQCTSDQAASMAHPKVSAAMNDPDGAADRKAREARYTQFPPFRFAASFPNSRLLKDKERVYSRTVFYAGSLWNIYIQKVASSRGKQLGVYLHRAKECEPGELFVASTVPLKGSVDQRIGQLERDMLMNGNRDQGRPRRRTTDSPETDLYDLTYHDCTANPQTASVRDSQGNVDVEHTASILSATRGIGRFLNRHTQPVSAFTEDNRARTAGTLDTRKDDDASTDEEQDETHHGIDAHTIPPYVDGRPTIKTYFKIYSPSRGGRMLSVYESAPDTFNFSQSWGWKSSTLMLDEGMLSSHPIDEADDGAENSIRSSSDGRLRFMVVIGNI